MAQLADFEGHGVWSCGRGAVAACNNPGAVVSSVVVKKCECNGSGSDTASGIQAQLCSRGWQCGGQAPQRKRTESAPQLSDVGTAGEAVMLRLGIYVTTWPIAYYRPSGYICT